MVADEVKDLTFGFIKVLEDTVAHFGVWLSAFIRGCEIINYDNNDRSDPYERRFSQLSWDKATADLFRTCNDQDHT